MKVKFEDGRSQKFSGVELQVGETTVLLTKTKERSKSLPTPSYDD